MNISELQTGDILLCSGTDCISRAIEYFTGSKISHVAMVLRNPHYINKSLNEFCVLQSTITRNLDLDDKIKKSGVQIISLDELLSEYKTIYVRRLLINKNREFYDNIKDIYFSVKNKPYDTNLLDWLKADLNIHSGNETKDNSFWCSALLTYIYIKLKLLYKYTNWTTVKPSQFSSNDKNKLIFINCIIENDILLKY